MELYKKLLQIQFKPPNREIQNSNESTEYDNNDSNISFDFSGGDGGFDRESYVTYDEEYIVVGGFN